MCVVVLIVDRVSVVFVLLLVVVVVVRVFDLVWFFSVLRCDFSRLIVSV